MILIKILNYAFVRDQYTFKKKYRVHIGTVRVLRCKSERCTRCSSELEMCLYTMKPVIS